MSTTDIHVLTLLQSPDTKYIALAIVLVYCVGTVCVALYNAYFGPLSKFPGPKTRAVSILPSSNSLWSGTEVKDMRALHETYGDVVRVAPNSLSFIGTPDVWKGIYGFRKAGQAENIKDSVFYGQTINRMPGLITANYSDHARQRKIVSNAFSDKALKELEPMFKTWAGKMKDLLNQKAAQSVAADMVRVYNFTTFDVMGDLTFSNPLHMLENSDYVPWVKTIFGSIKYATGVRAIKQLNSFCNWGIQNLLFRVPALRKLQMEHWRYTSDRVDRRLAKTPDRTDLWSIILSKGGDPKSTDAMLSLEEHRSIASVFMVAGTETTATALSGITYHLLQNPEYMDRLKTELRSAFSSIDDMHLDILAQLPYLEATIKEGLRMYPPVPIGLPRIAPPDGVMVGEHFVPGGTSMSVHHFTTYRHEGNFHEASKFRPERWLNDSRFANDTPGALEPFSVGPRNCIGKNLAWHELRLLLATTLVHFDLELCDESRTWIDQKVYTLWEKGDLMCKVKEVVK